MQSEPEQPTPDQQPAQEVPNEVPATEQPADPTPVSEATESATSPQAGDPEAASGPEAPAVDAGDGAPSEDAAVPAAEGGSEASAGDAPRKGGRGRRRGGRRNHGGRGPHRVKWDDVFLKQRLSLLRAMPADAEAVLWAVKHAGAFDVAAILSGEGSSGREFGRRAYSAKPETDDQAAWIILSAVRARDIIAPARLAVSGIEDQREQVKAAIETIGQAKVAIVVKAGEQAQQVFAQRASRKSEDVSEDARKAWALLALARPQDVQYAVQPRKGGPGGRPGGRDGGRDGERRGRAKREPGIPGGIYTTGESTLGGQLGQALREALERQQQADAEK